MTTAEILEKAAEYIEEHGWKQGFGGYLSNPNGPACIHIALENVKDSECGFLEAAGELGGVGEVWEWNDTPGRTQEEVCRMLRTVAAKLDARSGAQEPLYGPPSINLDSDVISALVEHTEAYSVDRDYGDENWEERRYTPVEA